MHSRTGVRSRVAAIVVMLLTMIFALVAQPAAAQGADLDPHPDIAAVMSEHPGGKLLSPTHAVWPDLGMEMFVPSAEYSLFAVGSCATGRVCAYSGHGLTGSALSWTSCGTVSVSAFVVRSIANARSSGYFQARQGSTVHATANAGGWSNVYNTVNNVHCVP